MPPMPTIHSAWKQTKEFAVRQSLTGKVILQVEERRQYGKCYGEGIIGDNWEYRWRDAKLGDYIDYRFTR